MPQFDLFCFGNLLILSGIIISIFFLLFKKELYYRMAQFSKFKTKLENLYRFITTVKPIVTLVSDMLIRSFFIFNIKIDTRRIGRAKNYKTFYIKKS